jgi:formylglycine-generating enzyme
VINSGTLHPSFTTKIGNTAFDMIYIEGGTFTMGAAEDDPDASSIWGEIGQHSVHLSRFHLGKYPVTQALFKAVMGGYNPSQFIGDDRPAEKVSWLDAAVFCNQLNELLLLEPCYFSDSSFSQLYGKTAKGYELSNQGEVFIRPGMHGYRLPTEAEWEYAARGGSNWKDGFQYAGTNKLKEVGWFDLNSHQETKPAGLKQHNQLGLYDMSGNVWEWCQDWFDGNYYQECLAKGTVTNPTGPINGSNRVFRGGSWFNYPQDCRTSYRNYWYPDARDGNLGFRLCLASSEVGVRIP